MTESMTKSYSSPTSNDARSERGKIATESGSGMIGNSGGRVEVGGR